jgi:serine/threonine-protein kinase
MSQGGFGAVYRAWDENLDQTVALKENLHVGPEAQRQFRREATLLANLRHPNLPRVIDHFILPDRGQYLIMDFIEGRSLAELLRANGRPFSEAEVLPWIRQVCSALAYLHGRQPPIIHRDIKPENIIITPESQATLVDFGISKVLAGELTTTVGARGITPGYSPPEQYGGTTDARSDIYALGATLYAVLAGRKPTDSVLLVAGNEPLTPPRVINGALKPATEETILKAMQLDRSKRFTDVNSLLAGLEREESPGHVTVLDAPPGKSSSPMPPPVVRVPAARKPSPSPQRVGSPERSWLRPIALIGGILGLIAVTFWGWQLMAGNSNTVVATATPDITDPAVVELTTQAGDIRVVTLPGGPEVIEVFVPAGSFLMGSAEGDPLASNDEFPQHTVTLDAFWLDQTEVTNAQFAAFLNERGNQEEGGVTWLEVGSSAALIESRDGAFQPKAGFENHPVIEVSWYGARAYCEWTGGRLPTEAEWEYAARGPDSLVYPWGNQAPTCSLANYGHCVAAKTQVGSYVDGASWVGALDMSGNVWEWVNDWYDSGYYQNAPSANPTGLETGRSRVLRGGAWNRYNQDVRAAYRNDIGPDNRFHYVGFRCAQE